MLQDISNLLIFDIDSEQEIYDDKNMNYDTSFLQFSFQHFSQIKDVAYSKELEQEIHDDENMNCDTFFPQLNGISEQLEDFTIDDKKQENYDITVNTLSSFSVRPSYLQQIAKL
ncbi:hypothetical protein RhiirA4_491100 [Rhizophagus irregularis]|uniref:Uncharacterized protein n=1 Tax=Rhizophagus irregularis TaxID=588596 RepID=A0A2I1HWD4_9GLOM|nr:hypothetical protein RhiirA4_491100 [Rhizophagus irregularis]